MLVWCLSPLLSSLYYHVIMFFYPCCSAARTTAEIAALRTEHATVVADLTRKAASLQADLEHAQATISGQIADHTRASENWLAERQGLERELKSSAEKVLRSTCAIDNGDIYSWQLG